MAGVVGRRGRGRPRSVRSIAAEAVAALIEVEWSVRRGVVARAVRAAEEAQGALGEFVDAVRDQTARERVAMA